MSDDRLHHLLDRLRRGVLLEAEADQLAGLVAELETENATLRDGLAHCRHKPRITELEQQLDDATGELAEARDHNDRTCEAVQERDQLRTEVARLTAGQCTHTRRMCDLHHDRPVTDCPYPRCVTAREQETGRA
jgi:hypothetical protein